MCVALKNCLDTANYCYNGHTFFLAQRVTLQHLCQEMSLFPHALDLDLAAGIWIS